MMKMRIETDISLEDKKGILMNINEAVKIINGETVNIPTNEELINAHKVFFKSFGVELQNNDGTYKSVYQVFDEASRKFNKSN